MGSVQITPRDRRGHYPHGIQLFGYPLNILRDRGQTEAASVLERRSACPRIGVRNTRLGSTRSIQRCICCHEGPWGKTAPSTSEQAFRLRAPATKLI